jgi:diphosphoinositol-polyphosphate diphosphatase
MTSNINSNGTSTSSTPLSTILTKTPREGREHQVYNNDDNSRLVAGGIILDSLNERVLMISSSKHKDRWILPKGGVESDEKDDFAKAALRETWEEAGAVCKVIKKLPVIADHRKGSFGSEGANSDKNDKNSFPLCEFHFYQLSLLKLEQTWPESSFRLRRWATYSEAQQELQKSKRPELLLALNDSDIKH